MKSLALRAMPAVFMAISLMASSCSSPFETNYGEILELKDNRKLWEEQKPNNYQFTLVRYCFCSESARGPLQVDVLNDHVISVRHQELEIFQGVETGATIEDLFDIAGHLMDGHSEVSIAYDSRLGYPTRISSKVNFPDGSFGILVKNLVELQAP